MAGDPDHGRFIVQNQGCLECHTVNAAGASHESIFPAKDLAARLATTYTPSALASALWNHSPRMWNALSQKAGALPTTSERDWEDVFAYLYSLQFFELPAEVRRGKAVLDSKCGGCHAASGPAPAPTNWKDVDDPVTLVYQMWNHAPGMSRTVRQQGKEWPRLNARDVMDLTAYLQNLRNEAPNRQLSLPPASEGRALFGARCAQCHTGARSLDTRLRNKTWMDIGAGMWNHAPDMRSVPAISAEDMPKILAYVWDLQYRGAEGSLDQGHRTFNQRCVTCHRDATTGEARSPRPGQSFTAFSMVALSWGRAREMHQGMEGKGVRWPSLSAHEVNNLVAFLNSIPR
jgi:mono/diheme cytochrome c family protein